MHAADPEEPQVLLYQVPLPRVLNWNKWWHLVARVILRAFQKRYWGLIGSYLQRPEVRVVVNPHLARIRTTFGRGQGRLLPQLSNLAPK